MRKCTYLLSPVALLVVLMVAAPRPFSILAAKATGSSAGARRGDTASGAPAAAGTVEAAPEKLSAVLAAPTPAPYPSPAPYPYPSTAPAGPEPLATLLILLLFLVAAAALALRRRA